MPVRTLPCEAGAGPRAVDSIMGAKVKGTGPPRPSLGTTKRPAAPRTGALMAPDLGIWPRTAAMRGTACMSGINRLA